MIQKNNGKKETEYYNGEEEIQHTIEDSDKISLARLGLENLMKWLNERPIKFKTFLKHTGNILDEMIIDKCLKENLRYVGGRLIMKLKEDDTITLLAEMFFQNSQKEWIKAEATGSAPCSRFIDWNDKTEEICDLREKE